MIVAHRIVFVRTFKALVVSHRFLQNRDVLGIPPRSRNQKRRRSTNNHDHCRAPDPPRAPRWSPSRKKIGVGHRKDGHPSPRKLHESQLRKVLPKNRTGANHEHRRCRREQQQHAPQFPDLISLLFESRSSVRRNPRDPRHHYEQNGHARGDPIEHVVFRFVDHGKEKVVRWLQARRKRLRDIHPALLISRGQNVKARQSKAQRQSARAAPQQPPRSFGYRRPGKNKRHAVTGQHPGRRVRQPHRREHHGEEGHGPRPRTPAMLHQPA